MNNNRTWKLVIIGLAAASILLALLGPGLVSPRQKVREPALRPATGTVVAKGVVESMDEVDLTSATSGTVRRVLVKEGDTVIKGQLLLELDSDKATALTNQAAANLAAAEARLRELRAGYRTEEKSMAESTVRKAEAVYNLARDEADRKKRLFAAEAISLMELNRADEQARVAAEELARVRADASRHQTGTRREQIEQAEAEKNRASADMRHAEAVLKDYRVTSPIDGVVADRLKEPGEGVDAGTPLLKLLNQSALRIRAELEETDVGRVKEGQNVEVTVDAYPGKIYTGSVTKTYPTVQKKTQKSFDPMASFDINTQRIHVALNDFTGLKSGMTVTVRFK